MPTPERTSLDQIVAAARDLLETGGPAGLTMQAVADRVGVRPPSLYKRVRNRDDLIRLVVEANIRDLADQLEAAVGGPHGRALPGGPDIRDAAGGPDAAPDAGGGPDGRDAGGEPDAPRAGGGLDGRDAGGGLDGRVALGSLLRAYRAFALAHPAGYHLTFGRLPEASRSDPALHAAAVAPILRIAAGLAGPEHTLDAARMITAWVTGFIGIELAGAFNLGGDINRAFEYGITQLGAALDRTQPTAGPGSGRRGGT